MNPPIERIVHVPSSFSFKGLKRICVAVMNWGEQLKHARSELAGKVGDGVWAWGERLEEDEEGQDVDMKDALTEIKETRTLLEALGPLFPPVRGLKFNIFPQNDFLNPPTIHIHPLGISRYQPPDQPVQITTQGNATRYFRPLPPSLLSFAHTSRLSPSTTASISEQTALDLKTPEVLAYLRDQAKVVRMEVVYAVPVPGRFGMSAGMTMGDAESMARGEFGKDVKERWEGDLVGGNERLQGIKP